MRMTGEDTAVRISPPGTWGNDPGCFLTSLRSPWYAMIADLQDIVVCATTSYAARQGLKALQLPLTTRTVSCPTGLGSDSRPVPVGVNGVDTYLSDSMQFSLEYGCRVAPKGCYSITQSFRCEEPDDTHLNQFTHSEGEILGDLDDLIQYVEGLVRYLAASIYDSYARELGRAIKDLAHIERMATSTGPLPRVTFDEAALLLEDEPGCIGGEAGLRTLTRHGERRLMQAVSECVWVTHFDHLGVPFFQAFADETRTTAACADLLFGMGEVVGGGERHTTGAQLRDSLRLHGVEERDYAWYVRMKEELPLRTAGFGMGMERYLMWVLCHDDIRDMPLISRVDEEGPWPPSVDRP